MSSTGQGIMLQVFGIIIFAMSFIILNEVVREITIRSNDMGTTPEFIKPLVELLWPSLIVVGTLILLVGMYITVKRRSAEARIRGEEE